MQTGLPQASKAPQPTRPFERIENAAERAENLARSLDSFLVRVNGPQPEATDNPPLPPSTYVNQIDRLHAALNLIEHSVDALHSVG